MRRVTYIVLPLLCAGCAAPKAAAPGAGESEREMAKPASAERSAKDIATANEAASELRAAEDDESSAGAKGQAQLGTAGSGTGGGGSGSGYGSGRGHAIAAAGPAPATTANAPAKEEALQSTPRDEGASILLGGVEKKKTGPSTRYRLGDYVVYRYSGSALDEPVTLREEITAQEGLRLRIDVTVTRANETRAWVQVVTDTPQNQRNNVIDALFEKRGDGYVRLANEGMRDVLRLYEWVLINPDGKASGVRHEACARTIAGDEFACVCTSGRNTWQGRVVVFEDTECNAFLWTHGPSGFREAVGGDDVLRVEVVEAGRREGTQALPFDAAAQ